MNRSTKARTILLTAIVALALLGLMLPASAMAQTPVECESDYTVQRNDSLSKIADAQYGDYALYPTIVLATNARSVSDDSYTSITDPWLIIPDSKLCIPSIEAAQAGLTVDLLKNSEYESEWTRSKRAPLADGEYREQAAPGSATYTVVKLADRMAFGVSDGGQDMAAVILITDPGGSGTFYDLAVVVQHDGNPVNVATTLLGDRVTLNSLSVKDGEIVVDMLTQGPDDPFCCPTQRVVEKYVLQEDALVEVSSEAVGVAGPLADTLWTLVSYLNREGELASPLADTLITAEFRDDQVAGSAGCNRYFGSYELEGDRLTLGPVGSTAMACEEAIDAQERAYLAALQSAVSYQVVGGQLQLANAEGNLALILVEAEPVPLTGTTWQLRSYNDGKGALVSALAGTEITAAFGDDGSLTGSAGCNNYTASYQLEGSATTIGPAATTRMMCAEPEGIMEQESAYLSVLESATAYQIGGETLELTDAGGARVAVFSRAPAVQITGAVWRWEQTQTPVDLTVVEAPDRYTLEFSPDGQVSIQADCNRGSGTYSTDGKQLTIEIAITTLAACPPGSLGDQFIQELNGAAIHFTEDDKLFIDLKFDSGTMRFGRAG